MPIITKSLTQDEFNSILADANSTRDPDFLQVVDRIRKEKRLIVKGLSDAQKSFLRREFIGQIHVIQHLDANLIYLENPK